MPFTPFHMGAGALFKGIGGNHVSLTVFGFSQVVIDLDSLYNLVNGNWPIHTVLHTWVGATVAAVIAALLGKPICQWLLRVAQPSLGEFWIPTTQISWSAAFAGALLGGWSHVLLDSIMHGDMRPLWPFDEADVPDNALLGLVDVGTLHQVCVIVGILGLVVFVLRRLARLQSAK